MVAAFQVAGANAGWRWQFPGAGHDLWPDEIRLFFSGHIARMTRNRPFSITIIAWFFIISGIFAAWDMISGFWEHRPSLNLGVLFIFLGNGLLTLRPAPLSWALAVVVLGWIFLAVAIVCGVCGVYVVHMNGEEVKGGLRWLVLIAFA